ncbi:MAG: S9 family peptidase [Gammaproteobacteria bacterium]|jgi:dipeptidyl aminopeptidase/acylaminoacyl peptidase|nr:S9 family peptidase [Gammaproteobacteria bacterium]
MKNLKLKAVLLSSTAVILCLGLSISPRATAQAEDARGWTPELSMQFRRIQGTAISPDGTHIAYIVNTPLMEGDQSEFRTQIWVVTADGSRNIQYTRADFSATSPAFSPDGENLSFISKRGEGEDEKSQVWVMPLFGGEARPLTKAENNISSYRWSPDGDRIAFTMQDPLSKEREKEIEEKRDVILVDQQPRYTHLHVVSVGEASSDSVEAVQITAGEMVVGGFSWSPRGDAIAFAHKPIADLNVANQFGDISRVSVPNAQQLQNTIAASIAADESDEENDDDDSDGPLQILGEVTPLVAGNGVESSPHWSPDGNWIAYTSSGLEPNLISLNDVYVIPANGGDSRMLAETPNRNANIAGWSTDSDELFLTEPLGTHRSVIGLPLRGDNIRTLTPEQGVAGNVSLASNSDNFSYSWESPDQPWDIHLQATDDNAASVQLTNIHKDIEIPEMGRTELLSWTAPDGMEIEGLLTYPVAYEPGNSYPIILNVHGGPSGVYSERFTGEPGIYMAQYFAQQGFAILRPNPRGSTGYGYEFRAATAADWGYGDLQDLLTGLDLVIQMGIGDADNQFLMGWSYGGYMTSFAVTQTDRFNAASMGAGLTNLVSMATTTDIRDYLVEHMGEFFWDDPDAFWRSSAIHHIENVVTPTQVIHGQEDLRVPLSQGQEFYNSLKWRGVDTEMIIYPRTPHGPREPKFLMDVSGRILTWFNKYRD